MKRRAWLTFLALATACTPAGDSRERVVLVTTTTVEASGLLDTLLDAYHAAQGRYHVAATATGSGAALEMGRRGDADVLLTHDPVGEARFVAEGHGRRQGPVMANDFVLVGPPDDPAGVSGARDLAVALGRIRDAGAPFVTRGDDSGTHRAELRLWRRAGATAPAPTAAWYLEAGSGMEETLRIADQRGAYTLTDWGTFGHLREHLALELLARGEPPEENRYQYTVPAGAGESPGARDFVQWLVGPGQDVIARYGTDRHAEPLFRPAGAEGGG